MTTMRLSEAMRLGAMLKPQGFGGVRGFDGADESCAMRAALDAVGVSPRRGVVKVWPWLDERGGYPCPECGGFEQWAGTVIAMHLNDTHRWPRERIADWVATVEPVEIALPVVAEILTSFDEVPTS